MRRRLLPLIAGLGLLAAPALAAEPWRELSRKTIPAQGLESVTVHNARGRIDARPSPDRDIHVTAVKIVRGRSHDETREIAQQTRVELGREGDEYAIRVRYPRSRSIRVNIWDGFSEISLPRVEVRLTIEVPARLALQLEAASGDITSDGVDGQQSVRTASGDVRVEGAGGAVEVRTASGDVAVDIAASLRVSTASGDVQVSEIAGPVVVSTASGDVSIPRALDSLRVQTVSGDVIVERAGRGVNVSSSSGEVVLRRAAGDVAASTVSGRLQAGITSPLRRASMATTSGDIHLDLERDLACTLDLQTSSGAINLDVPVRTRSVSRRHVVAVVGEGGSPASLRSVSGSITVSAGEP